MIRFADRASLLAALDNLPAPCAVSTGAARARQAELTKPPGSLGRLEDIAVFMAGWQGTAVPRLHHVRGAVFAGNHGIAQQGVSAFPPEVTRQMVDNFMAGGAAINVLARCCEAQLSIVPLDLDRPTGDIAQEPAMSDAECLKALNAGAAVLTPETQLLFVGEMGIGNTTPAAALAAAAFGGDGNQWCGYGTGVGPDGLARKIKAVDRALALHHEHCTDPFETLRRLGGREIAAMAGAILAARLHRIPVLLDGFIASAAIAPFTARQPRFADHCIAAHCSAEAAHQILLERLGLQPLLRLGLRLGEGSGAALAVPIIRAAIATHGAMATFAEAKVARS
ncbi:nicotinate-nucleotide--dimethylbenzimidazole phosphoribosyltransferase [Novosphingobium panipatense]|uniref:Nicotinate-nucleotide--dimethylbenzimidazole phosphoribosyltransferase n=1 Tax=Novosphingobium panipatense TaxID=428991 RepID=A0ABY1QRJ8_9SPHN|nr:nicotinate-nucleotide--dimethylbenzimidazole phosphoribosyltransferase [Novosphingobium panipatense]SMP78410.1 nicotinate-nucleotide-dimethylbenzimidazole phosphoribosyltransferase [Novosphingobium panipatense]